MRANTGGVGAPIRTVKSHNNSPVTPHYDMIILGGGPCGLGAAWAAEQRRGKDLSYRLIDANRDIGGSAGSVTTAEGFVYDYGGHILYPHAEYTEFTALLDALIDAWHESKPVRGVWLDGRLIPYPVQRNIHHLSPHKMVSALKGLSRISVTRHLRRRPAASVSNLEEHLHARFGRGLTKHVLGPLNEKMWAHHPTELGASWTGHRSGSHVPNVPDASVRQILRSLVTGRDNLGWNETTRVRYPLRGGSGAIWSRLRNRLPADVVISGTRVTQVDSSARTILLSNGQQMSYRHLISSIPLDQFLGLLKPNPLPELATSFRLANAAFVGLGFRGEPPPSLVGVHSFHMPEPDIPCWRVNFPKSLSPYNVPRGRYWSILCEISHSCGSDFDIEQAEVVIISKLRQRGIIPADSEIVSRWHAHMQHGYPIPFLGRDAVLSQAQNALQELGIFSRGRFGGWKYEVSNQDHSFMQGMEAVELIRDGTQEATYRLEPA